MWNINRGSLCHLSGPLKIDIIEIKVRKNGEKSRKNGKKISNVALICFRKFTTNLETNLICMSVIREYICLPCLLLKIQIVPVGMHVFHINSIERGLLKTICNLYLYKKPF